MVLARRADTKDVFCSSDDSLSDGEHHAEGERLTDQPRQRLLVCTPIPAHGHPAGVAALDPGTGHGPTADDVGDEHQLIVVEALDSEPHTTMPDTQYTLVQHWDDVALVDPDHLPRRLCHVEVHVR
jgi:hypothetical protein